MAVTKKDVKQVAMLSRIMLDEAEADTFVRHLSKIVDYIGQLGKLDTSRVSPAAHVLPIRDVYRDDRVKRSLPQEDVTGIAPASEGGLVRVPRVIEDA